METFALHWLIPESPRATHTLKRCGRTGVDLIEILKDSFGHGTAIAGQIAAREVSGSNLSVFAPQSTIVPTFASTSTPATTQARRQGTGWLHRHSRRAHSRAADQGISVIIWPAILDI